MDNRASAGLQTSGKLVLKNLWNRLWKTKNLILIYYYQWFKKKNLWRNVDKYGRDREYLFLPTTATYSNPQMENAGVKNWNFEEKPDQQSWDGVSEKDPIEFAELSIEKSTWHQK